MTDSVISFRQRPYLSSVTTNVVPQEEAAGYTAVGINFDGTNDWLEIATDFTGPPADAKVGILSFWLKMQGGDAGFQAILEMGGGTFGLSVYRWNDNKIRIVGNTTGDVVTLDLKSTTDVVAGGAWKHILASWDLATATAQFYLSDANDANVVTADNTNIDYSKGNAGFGARFSAGTLKLNADIADFYLNVVTSLDLSNSTNRRKFISAGGAPVDLGSDGSTPTGTAPLIFLSDVVGGWHSNRTPPRGAVEASLWLAAR
jgi:hypothetical protein